MIQFDTILLSGLTNVELPIFGASANEPFLVSTADGLGPPELNVLLAETHSSGGMFVARRAQGREIVIRCGLNPDYTAGQTISDLRYILYGLLSPGVDGNNQSIDLTLTNDNVPQVTTTGYVKRIEIVPFNKEPQVQITISCLSPYWRNSDITNHTVPDSNTWTIDNPGLAPTGIEFQVQFGSAQSSFTIEVLGGAAMRFYSSFQSGDQLTVNTNEGSRFVGLYRSGQYIKYMELMSSNSTWLTLYGGVHTIETSDHTAFSWDYFRFYTRHWGI
jgi:hypothetical protein